MIIVLKYYMNAIKSLNIKRLYENICQKIIDEASKWDNAAGDFARNYSDMINADWKYSDKYFHAKANCLATQRGGAGEEIEKAISLLREIEEGTRKVIVEGVDLTAQLKDANQDMEANAYGREQAKKYPDIDCRILLNKYRPRNLPKQY